MINFHVGQKVVCVDATGVTECLKEGSVYEIDNIEDDPDWKLMLHLRGFQETSFWFSSRFRPLIERKTDISVFHAMLNPSKVEEPA